MKKFFNLNHPSIFLFGGGIVFGALLWFYRDHPRWLQIDRFPQKHFDTMWTLTGIGIGISILMIIVGLIWLNASNRKD